LPDPSTAGGDGYYSTRMSSLKLCALAAVLLASATARGATVLDANFVESDHAVSPLLEAATGLAWAPDGSNRLFVTRKNGEIMIVKNGLVLPTPFATLSPIYTGSECGLLGIAFDPDFLANKYLYVFVTVSAGEQQIVRYTVSGDQGADKLTIVSGLPTRGANHDGGGIGFGPDGKLYWSIGDNGANAGTGADLSSLASKVGRANRNGLAPMDNPFRDGSGARDFIWARGMRNPFTLAFQPATGLLWLNVVGDSYEQIFIVRAGDHGGYGAQEVNQRPPNIRPVIKYRTNGVEVINLRPEAMNGAVRKSGVITFSGLTEHWLRVGEKVTVRNVVDASFNGDFFVTSVPTETTFTVTQAGPDATSGSAASPLATATTAFLGGCVTGGDFYDSSQAPPGYRGNFFFGDYNTAGQIAGRLMRAAIDPAGNTVTSVDLFGTQFPGAVDVALGPDGALYWVGTATNRILRIAHKVAAQGLVVSPLNLWTAERESVVVNVSLATAPAANVTVTVARASGDPDIGVSAGAALTFTPANWNVPQIAVVAAAADADDDWDQAAIAVSAPGLATETVSIRARDQDTAAVDAGPDLGSPDGLAADTAPISDATTADAATDARDSATDVAVAPDASADAGISSGPDAGNGLSAGGGGCGCRVGGGGEGPGAAAALALLLGRWLGRRRRVTGGRS
jgi:MYXO-CTERM domain-containing protein